MSFHDVNAKKETDVILGVQRRLEDVLRQFTGRKRWNRFRCESWFCSSFLVRVVSGGRDRTGAAFFQSGGDIHVIAGLRFQLRTSHFAAFRVSGINVNGVQNSTDRGQNYQCVQQGDPSFWFHPFDTIANHDLGDCQPTPWLEIANFYENGDI